MVRPTIFEKPMTAAERMKRMRARRKRGVDVRQERIETNTGHPFAWMTVKDHVDTTRISERTQYHIRTFIRHSLIEWDEDVTKGKYGRVGVSFLADVCRYGDARTQSLIQQVIIREGAQAARDIWDKMKFEAGLPNKHMLKQTKIVERRRG